MEKIYKRDFEQLKKEIIDKLNNTTYPNVKVISSNIVIINSSYLSESWLPEYHIPGKQAELIASLIKNKHNLDELLRLFIDLSKTKTIICGKNRQKVNPSLQKTIDQITRELGAY